MLTPLGRLCQFMNFERICTAPPIVVTMDHRAVLVAAWAAQVQGLFGDDAPHLFRFDAHPDLGEKPREWAYEKSLLTDLDRAHMVANMQRYDDGGWVISAMQFGLCGDVTTCFVHDYHRFPGDSSPYEDHTGKTHRLRTYPGLRDIAVLPRPEVPVWVDIDLDFATRRNENGDIRVWNAEDWENEFAGPEGEKFAELLNRACLVTIATEPWFCGGIEECGQIAAGLKKAMSSHGGWFANL